MNPSKWNINIMSIKHSQDIKELDLPIKKCKSSGDSEMPIFVSEYGQIIKPFCINKNQESEEVMIIIDKMVHLFTTLRHNNVYFKSIHLYRFLCIRAVYGEEVSPSVLMDDLWHQLVLETSLYRSVCKSIFKQWDIDTSIIDHSLLSSTDPEDIKDTRYRKCLSVYNSIYECNTLPSYWPSRRIDINPEPNLTLYIRTLQRSTYTIHVYSEDTVETISYIIRERTGVPIHMQRLIWSGRQLDPDYKISKYKYIQNESTITLITRLLGC